MKNPKRTAATDFQCTCWGKNKKIKEKYKNKFLVRQHYVATSCLKQHSAWQTCQINHSLQDVNSLGTLTVSK